MEDGRESTVIHLSGVNKQFGKAAVLRDLSWQVPKGHIIGLLGLNGSGKTTLLRLLMGIVRPTSGTATVLGHDVRTAALEIRQAAGYVAERTNIPGAFTADRLEQVGQRVFPRWDPAQYEVALRRFRVARSKPMYLLSQGQRTLTALAFALAHHAELLLLDEPTNGLDPLVRREFLAHLIEASYDHGRTVVVSSHRLEEVSHLAQDVAVLHGGQLAAVGPIDDLLQRDHLLTVRVRDEMRDFSALPGASRVSRQDQRASVYVHNFADREQQIAETLQGWGVTEWTHHPVTLEQLFEERVGGHVD
jgi:ABC-2 type transport system ATP-binding protein